MPRRRKSNSGRWLAIAAVLGIVGWLGWSLTSGQTSTDAYSAFSAEDFETARNDLARRVAARPDDDRARYYLGVASRHRRLDEDALAQLTALRASPEWREHAFYQVVRTLLDAERLSDAESEIEQMEPMLDARPLAREAAGLYHLASAQDIEKRILERLDRSIGDRETVRVKGRIQRILRANEQVFTASLERFARQLREEHGLKDPDALSPMFAKAQRSFSRAQESFLAAIAAAESDPALSEVPWSRFEAARILEARRRPTQTEELRRALVAIPTKRLLGDLDLELDFNRLREAAIQSLGQQLIREGRPAEVAAVVELVPLERNGRRPYRFESLLAQSFDALGDDEALFEITDHWLEADSAPAEINYLRGKYHFRRQEYELAIHHLEKAHNAVPGRRLYRSLLAKGYAAVANYDRAQKHWDVICQAEPNNWEAHLARIRCLEGLKWTEEARQELSQLLRNDFSDRRSAGYQALREFMDAFLERNGLAPRDLYSAKKLYSEDPQNFEAGTLYLRYLREAGDLATAARVASRLKRDIPEDHEAAFDVAMACGELALERRAFEEARVCFTKAASERPFEASAFAGEARSELGAERPEAAWRAVEKIDILAPEHPDLLPLKFELYALAGDEEQVAETGLALLERAGEERSWPMVRRTIEAALDTGREEAARGLLKEAKGLDKATADDELDYALLLDRAGGFPNAESLTFRIVAANADDSDLVARAATRYLEKGRTQSVINALEPLVAENDLISTELLDLLASAYEKEGDVGRRLAVLARLRRRDAKAADLAVARFCAAREAWPEILSITENARNEKRLHAPLLRLAAEAALQLKNLDQARRLAKDLAIEVDTEFADTALVRARLLEATTDVEGARVVLTEALPRVRVARRSEVRLALVNLFGRSGQANAMMGTIQEALNDNEDVTGLTPVAARHIIRLGLPNASAIVNDAVQRFGAQPSSLLDRGLLRLSAGDTAGALEDIRSSHEAAPTVGTAHALAMLYAMLGDRSRLDVLLRPSSSPGQPRIDQETRTHAQILRPLQRQPKKNIQRLIRAIEAPSEAEREAYIALLDAIADLGETKSPQAGAARTALARFWTLDHFSWMYNQALAEIQKLKEFLPAHGRALDLMRARLLMRDRATWNEGVGIVARLLESSSMSDEAALMIYLEQYLVNGESGAVRLLVDVMLRAEGFSHRCYRDAAHLLLRGGRPEAAARLLHRSGDSSAEKRLLEARALLEIGAPARAESVLAQLSPEVAASAEALTLKARLLIRDANRRQSAYRYANQALRDFALDDPSRLLLHARCCFAVDRADEGWSSIDRWVALAPASAAQLGAAIDAVNASAVVDGPRRDGLYARLRLLDPAAFVRAR